MHLESVAHPLHARLRDAAFGITSRVINSCRERARARASARPRALQSPVKGLSFPPLLPPRRRRRRRRRPCEAQTIPAIILRRNATRRIDDGRFRAGARRGRVDADKALFFRIVARV